MVWRGNPTTSNMWVIGKAKPGCESNHGKWSAVWHWYAPAYTYGIGLHGAGYDVTGNTPFAYPGLVLVIMVRFPRGSTAGFGDDVDILLNGCRQRNQSYYLHNGKWVKMLKP